MRSIISMIFFALAAVSGFAQQWDRTYPNISPNDRLEITHVLADPAGGYFAFISDLTAPTGTAGLSLMKVDHQGITQQVKSFTSGGRDRGQDMIFAADGGVVTIARSFSSVPGPPYRLTTFTKFDNQLNPISQATECAIGQIEDAYTIIPASPGLYWLSCVSFFPDFLGLVRLVSDQGTTIQIVTAGLDDLVPAVILPDGFGGFKAFCHGIDGFGGLNQMAFNTYDANGTLTGQKSFYEPGVQYEILDVIPTMDGGYMVLSSEFQSIYKTVFTKLDAQCNIVFRKTWNNLPYHVNAHKIAEKADGSGYRVLVDDDERAIYEYQAGYIDTDLDMNIGTKINYTGISATKGFDMLLLPDMGTVIGGSRVKQTDNQKTNPWLMRTNAQGQFTDAGVSGQIRYDQNQDCISDKDSLTGGFPVYAFQDGVVAGSTITDVLGNYFIPLSPGNYKVFPQFPNTLWSTCTDTIPVLVTAGDTTKNTNFAAYYYNFPVDSMSGYVFADIDHDCVKDSFETEGYANWTVVFSMNEGNLSYAETHITNADGYYSFTNFSGFTNAAQRFIYCIPPPELACDYYCPNELMLPYPDGPNMQYNLGVQCDSIVPCFEMNASIGAQGLRPCLPSTYNIYVFNNGTLGANDTYAEVTIDSGLVVTGASVPWTSQNGNVYTFYIGTLNSYENYGFSIDVFVPCTDSVGTTYCSTVHAYPDTLCVANGFWDGSEVQVRADCVGDSVVFTITNVGTGAMSEPTEYIVIEDNVLLMNPGSFQLNAGASTTVTVPANGAFLRLESEQTPGFPGLGIPVAWSEGCGGSGQVSMGFVNAYPLGDDDPWIDINCTQSVNSYDPNDKRGFPTGVKEERFIGQNVELEYIIRFQNTGTAPALNVEIRDSIPVQWLDPVTVRPGASSHAYEWNMQGNGVVVFRFPDIQLPDSSSNPEASQGFVQFHVRQRPNVPIGTQILNDAAIYFDNNAPVITNETLHTIGKDYLVSAIPVLPDVAPLQVDIWPNPMSDHAQVLIHDTNADVRSFRLLDMLGRPVLEQEFTGQTLRIPVTGLASGVYFYEISAHGLIQAQGKLVKRR